MDCSQYFRLSAQNEHFLLSYFYYNVQESEPEEVVLSPVTSTPTRLTVLLTVPVIDSVAMQKIHVVGSCVSKIRFSHNSPCMPVNQISYVQPMQPIRTAIATIYRGTDMHYSSKRTEALKRPLHHYMRDYFHINKE